MRIKHPSKRAIRDWIVKVMMDDPHLSVLVDLASSEHRRAAWVESFNSPGDRSDRHALGADDPMVRGAHDRQGLGQGMAARPIDVALARIEADAAVALERVGYRLLAVEVDVGAGRARVEVRRHDGYALTLDVRHGAGTITREMMRHETGAVGRRGDRFIVERLSMRFLGRTRVIGARQAMRAFAETIGDNAAAVSNLDSSDATGALLALPVGGE